MEIELVDTADDTAMARWYGPMRTSELADWPGEPGWSLRELAALVRQQAVSESVLAVASCDGEDAGSSWVRMPLRESRDLADVNIAVDPAWRRKGVGRALVERAEQIAQAKGRSRLTATTEEPLHPGVAAAASAAVAPAAVAEGGPGGSESPGSRFALAAGFEPALREARRRLNLPIALDRLESLEAASLPYASGYRIVTWTGTCPPEWQEGRIALARSISTDAPQGTLDKEAEEWDRERLAVFEATVEAMDRDAFSAGAVTASGELVGFTQVGVPRTARSVGYQFDTVVLPTHRGHRLGLLVKVANLRALQAASPATEYVLTWNAAENDPMIRVNDVLGFEVVGVGTLWKKVLA